jgi:shikimate dehydrogenase
MSFLRLAVLGDPVAHSLSPVIHAAAMEYAGLRGAYSRRRVDQNGMRRAADDLRSGRLTGANVTMPHKALAAGLADRRSGAVVRSGGANTLWMENGRLHADSTDPDGVRFAWQHARLPGDAPVLLLGAGAAAAAALLALSDRDVRVAARRPEAAHDLVARVGAEAVVAPWGQPVAGAVLVNATPLGMRGEALPTGVLEEAGGLLELAYGRGQTPAEAALAARDLPVASGELVLVGQGAASFTIWTGVEVPPTVMLEALSGHRDQPTAPA